MDEPIVNRVEESGLIQLDLGQLLKPQPTAAVDLAEWLDQGMVLREKPFRQQVAAWEASSLSGHVVALNCSSDAILPDWAWMLVAAKLQSSGATSLVGSLADAQTQAWQLAVESLDLDTYRDQRVIVKGVPPQAALPRSSPSHSASATWCAVSCLAKLAAPYPHRRSQDMVTPPSDKKLFLVDAYALIFRAYYVHQEPRINTKGMNTSAVFGF